MLLGNQNEPNVGLVIIGEEVAIVTVTPGNIALLLQKQNLSLPLGDRDPPTNTMVPRVSDSPP